MPREDIYGREYHLLSGNDYEEKRAFIEHDGSISVAYWCKPSEVFLKGHYDPESGLSLNRRDVGKLLALLEKHWRAK